MVGCEGHSGRSAFHITLCERGRRTQRAKCLAECDVESTSHSELLMQTSSTYEDPCAESVYQMAKQVAPQLPNPSDLFSIKPPDLHLNISQ